MICLDNSRKMEEEEEEEEEVSSFESKNDNKSEDVNILDIKKIDKDTSKRITKRLLLKPIEMDFSPGIIYIVGESGTGKTTLIKYLTKTLSSKNVKIQIYGTNLEDINYKTLGKMMSYMSQSYELFKFQTIQQNIVSYNQFDQDIYRRVCELADIQFINPDNELDNKKATIEHLSAGERKKVHYARFLYQITINRNTNKYICLDEPTAAFDRKLSVAFFRQLKQLVKQLKLVAFVVDHSLLGIEDTSKVIFICNQEAHFGTHEELLENIPEYKELFTII